MRLSKERREQIGAYGQNYVSEAALISINDLVNIFNKQEQNHTTLEEMLHGLRRFIATTPKGEVRFAIYNDAYIFDIKWNKNDMKEMIVNLEASCCGRACGCERDDHELTTTEEIETMIEELRTENVDYQAELIGLTAEIAVLLYGILNFQELANILNHYHPDLNVVKDDILPALDEHMGFSGEDVDYTLFEGFIMSPMILPDANFITEADVELIDTIRAEQKKYARYLPDYEEFVLYASPIYEMMTGSFERLLVFLDKNSKRIGLEAKEIRKLATTFLQLLKAGMKPKHFIEFFQEEGCHFNSLKFINDLMDYANEVYNHTRMYELNGYTRNELGLDIEQGVGSLVNLVSTNTESVAQVEEKIEVQRIARKVGRNELCPCGSLKKYKKCCL